MARWFSFSVWRSGPRQWVYKDIWEEQKYEKNFGGVCVEGGCEKDGADIKEEVDGKCDRGVALKEELASL